MNRAHDRLYRLLGWGTTAEVLAAERQLTAARIELKRAYAAAKEPGTDGTT